MDSDCQLREKKEGGGETRQAGEYDWCPLKMCARFCVRVGCTLYSTSMYSIVSYS
jgi:hypothetical protein